VTHTGGISDRYGRKNAWLLHIYASLLSAAGHYDRFLTISWDRIGRLVFVCKGNICRSPYCETKARSLGVVGISRGLEAGSQGGTPKPLLKAAASRGLDLSSHQPSRFRPEELAPGDLVVVMDPEQAARIEGAALPQGVQITLLGIWHPKPRPDIQDPYGTYQAGGAFLSLAYYDVPYYLVVALVLTRKLVEQAIVAGEAAAGPASPAPGDGKREFEARVG
jgi:protein-tyrosine phosphatase